MQHDYKNYLTLDEFRERSGYDLLKRLEQGDFNNEEEAADRFMQDNFNELKSLIASKMGAQWTNNFLQDILTDANTNERVAELKEGFIEALVQHNIYRFEVGDPIACADSNLPRYSEHTIEALVNNRIIFRGA